MSVLDKLRAVHEARDMVHVHVPEYGFDLYFPPFTLADHEACRRGVRKGDDHTLMVNSLIHQARTEKGDKFFDGTPAEMTQIRAELHRMELGVMQRIMAEASGDLDAETSAELAALEIDTLRGDLAGVLGEAAPRLAEAIGAVPEGVLLRALQDVAAAQQAATPAKNG